MRRVSDIKPAGQFAAAVDRVVLDADDRQRRRAVLTGEISMRRPADIVRIAWHIGNRHTDMQVMGDTLRIRRDHVLEEMLRGLGAMVTPREESFDPEVVAPHSHENDHGA